MVTDYPHMDEPPDAAKRERSKKLLALLKEKGRIVFPEQGAGVITGMLNMSRANYPIDITGIFRCCLDCGAKIGDVHEKWCRSLKEVVEMPKPVGAFMGMTIYLDKSLPENVVQIGNKRFTFEE